MKIVEQSCKVWGECPDNREEAILWIEKAGRNCYKSHDKIVPGSGERFVSNIVKRGHLSVIEHSNFVIATRTKFRHPCKALGELKLSYDSKYFHFTTKHDRVFIAGNWRSWFEFFNSKYGNFKFSDFPGCIDSDFFIVKQKDIPTELKRITVELYTDRAVMAEITRHRPDVSFSIESQRYCRYTDDVCFIKPYHYSDDYSIFYDAYKLWENQMCWIEQTYKHLIEDLGEKAEEARSVLPNSTAVNIVMTAGIPEWKHIFNLRCSKAAYPQIRKLLLPVRDDFEKNGWL